MDATLENELAAWSTALLSEGKRATWVRDRVLYVRAVARHADKAAADITESDLSAYAAERGIKASTVNHYRRSINAFHRWGRTGVIALHPKRTATIHDMSAYIEWLRAGKYLTRSQTARRMSAEGAKTYAGHITSIAAQFQIHPTRITAKHVEGWLTTHPTTGPVYKNRCLRSLRYWAQFVGIEDPTADVRRFSEQKEEPKPRPASPECVAALLTHDDATVVAMAVLGASAGLRRHEISKVRAEDFTRRNGRYRLTVHGKGGKTRVIVLGNKSVARLSPVFVPGVTRGRLFPALSDDPAKGGNQVGDILSKAAAESGHTMTAHQLRHYAATTLYDATGDLEAVRRILGHSSIDTTMRYIRAWSDDRANDSADALDNALDGLTGMAAAA
jgi:site-specific recombinase XerD